MAASDFADWWDKQHRDYQELLQEFVDENPSVLRAGLATVATIPTELGAGLVDALRFGQGISEGSPGGVGMDVLRLLALAGPLGRVSRYLSSSAVTRLAIYMKDPARAAGICTWVAAAKALRQTGAGTLFANVDEIAEVMGQKVPVSQLPSLWADDLLPALRMMGAKVRNLGIPVNFADLERTAQGTLRTNQAMMFAVQWKNTANQMVGHTLYFFRDGLGRLRISDRTGYVVKTLAEYEKLVPAWKGIGKAEAMTAPGKGAMLLLEGPQMLYLKATESLAALMIPLVRLVAVNTAEVANVQALDTRFRSFRAAKTGGTPPPDPAAGPGTSQLPPVEWLTGVQARLLALGFYKGPVHGKFDPASKSAVIAFQQRFPPLRVDGIPGPKTQAKLKEVYGS